MNLDVLNECVFFFYFIFKVWGILEPDFFLELREYRSPLRASEKLASRLGRRAAPADLQGGERAAHSPIDSLSTDLFTPPRRAAT